MKDLLAFIGLACIIFVVAALIYELISLLRDFIIEKRYTYKYKHMFNKKPIAECYCHDCVHWAPATGRCGRLGTNRLYAETNFCCFAEPVPKWVHDQREKYKEVTK